LPLWRDRSNVSRRFFGRPWVAAHDGWATFYPWLAGIGFDRLQAGAVSIRLDHEQVLEAARQAVRDGRSDRLKYMLACPGPLLADDAGDPELSGLEHALPFKKLPRPARKGGGLFQTTGLLEP
jgi:hypothetical protein